MNDPKRSKRIIEILQDANLEPDADKALTLRRLVQEEAGQFQNLLDAGKCVEKICAILASELKQDVKPATFRAYLREALKGKRRKGGGKGGSSAPPVPKGPARLPPSPPAEAPAPAPEGSLTSSNAMPDRRVAAAYAHPVLPDFDKTIALPSATPSAPR